MNRSAITLFFLSLALLTIPDISFANKFVTIGGGVSGTSGEKFTVLKQIGAYTGTFFILLGVLSVVTKDRFEGFIGMRTKDQGVSPASYILIILGALLSLLFFV
ncbi:hypothetical protein [Sedimenticola sp.]|uniref:hypothetical protein n=1 Tax=Sedimenticola sp. TaxID=1940285 RepID=UPI003D146F60